MTDDGLAPVVGGAIVDTNLIWFADGRGPFVVHLEFRADGTVTWKREFYGRHTAESQ